MIDYNHRVVSDRCAAVHAGVIWRRDMQRTNFGDVVTEMEK